MKKILFILFVTFAFGAIAQSTIKLSIYDTTYIIGADEVIHVKTKANKTSIAEIDITNTGSTNNLYKVKRMDLLLNTDALAYFCFAGSCYTENVFTSVDTAKIAAGQSASQLAGDFQLLSADLVEGPIVGKSTIQYTVFNIDVPSDKVTFTIKYNASEAVGIKETLKSFSGFEIFPNPAKETTSIHLTSNKAIDANMVLVNALGETILKKELSLTEGKNKIDLNIENLNSGIYFVSIKSGDHSISKKLIID